MCLVINTTRKKKMKHIIKIFIFAVLVLTSVNAQEKTLFDKITYLKLDNGMQVYLLNDKKAEATSVDLSVAVGYDDATDKTYGITHLVEHMVFRDHRVPHSDYLDYIKDEGATYINAYTKRYETDYQATIGREKSDWLVKTFAKMLFDKDLNNEDLRIEKHALQTEISESRWYYEPLSALGHFFKFIAPPKVGFYQQEFALPKTKQLPDNYHAQENNKRFTLQEVKNRYKQYYYPANMTLMVAGNFDKKLMTQSIKKSFGSIKQKGTKSIHEPDYKAKLNGKPYSFFLVGAKKNYAYIGAKYLTDNYKKYLILNIYIKSLAERLEQKMRNKLGKTYSVNDYSFSQDDAGVISVGFDGLTDTFSDNIAIAKAMINKDSKGLEEKEIKKMLSLYEKKYYTFLEHNSDTLMNLLETSKYLREKQNITNKSSYSIFKSITAKEFNQTLSKVLAPQNAYEYISRNYYFFPMDAIVLTIILFILFVIIFIGLSRYNLKKMGLQFTSRDVVFQRRISSVFMGFLVIFLSYVFTSISYRWIVYFFSLLVMGDPNYLKTVDVPQGYILLGINMFLFMFLYFVIYRKLWHYLARMVVLKDKIVFAGNYILSISKEQIESMRVIKPKERKHGKTLGIIFRFWKPLLKLDLKDGSHYYIRSSNATHLKEDLKNWIEKS